MAKDSKMYYLEEDIQKIQVKTNMYINEYGEAGAFHLAREIIQNNFDECLDDDSPGNEINITYDKATDTLTSSDNGRSFNESEFDMKIFCTTLQSGYSVATLSKWLDRTNKVNCWEISKRISAANTKGSTTIERI